MDAVSGIAGIATAGAALASVLYDIVSAIRNAPREMIEIADSIHDLSTVLRELRRILRKANAGGSEPFVTSRLLRTVRGVTSRIGDIQERVSCMLNLNGGNLARVLWAFRKSKTTKLLATIESHKSTLQLIATTVTLAIAQRDQSGGARKSRKARKKRSSGRDGANGDDNNDDDAGGGGDVGLLRRQAETLVAKTERSLQQLNTTSAQDDQETQVEDDSPSSPGTAPTSVQTGGDSTSTGIRSPWEIQKWSEAKEDTATWLYNLVFGNGPQSSASSRSLVGRLPIPSRPTISGSAMKRESVNRLLQQWTRLSDAEVQMTEITKDRGPTAQLERDWETQFRLLKLDDERHDERHDEPDNELDELDDGSDNELSDEFHNEFDDESDDVSIKALPDRGSRNSSHPPRRASRRSHHRSSSRRKREHAPISQLVTPGAEKEPPGKLGSLCLLDWVVFDLERDINNLSNEMKSSSYVNTVNYYQRQEDHIRVVIKIWKWFRDEGGPFAIEMGQCTDGQAGWVLKSVDAKSNRMALRFRVSTGDIPIREGPAMTLQPDQAERLFSLIQVRYDMVESILQMQIPSSASNIQEEQPQLKPRATTAERRNKRYTFSPYFWEYVDKTNKK